LAPNNSYIAVIYALEPNGDNQERDSFREKIKKMEINIPLFEAVSDSI